MKGVNIMATQSIFHNIIIQDSKTADKKARKFIEFTGFLQLPE